MSLACWLLVLSLAGWLPSCKKGSAFVIDRVIVGSAAGLDVVGQTKAELEGSLRRHLREARFELADGSGTAVSPGPPPWRLVTHLHVEEPAIEGEPAVEVAAALTWHRRGAVESWQTEGRRTSPSVGEGGVAGIQRAARLALDEVLVEGISEARWLIDGMERDDAELVARLEPVDAGTARGDAALQVLARRRSPLVLPHLKQRLGTSNGSALRRTIGWLIDAKDPSAAGALIEASRGKEPVLQREIVFALGELGGPEAEAYLFTLAAGHEDPLLRASAERALEDLRARDGRGPLKVVRDEDGGVIP